MISVTSYFANFGNTIGVKREKEMLCLLFLNVVVYFLDYCVGEDDPWLVEYVTVTQGKFHPSFSSFCFLKSFKCLFFFSSEKGTTTWKFPCNCWVDDDVVYFWPDNGTLRQFDHPSRLIFRYKI